MKKRVCLMLALLLMLSCGCASAEIVELGFHANREVAREVMAECGVPEDQTARIDLALAVLSALSAEASTGSDGFQFDLNLNEQPVFSLDGWLRGTDCHIASTLFPNHKLTMTAETLDALRRQATACLPGADDVDISAVSEALGGYFRRYAEACIAATTFDAPEAIDYVYADEYLFDTFSAFAVDLSAVNAAWEALADEMLGDEALISAIRGFGLGYDPEAVKALFIRMVGGENGPVSASGELYTKHDSDQAYCCNVNFFRAGGEDPYCLFSCFAWDDGIFNVTYIDYESERMICLMHEPGTIRGEYNIGQKQISVDIYYTFDPMFTTTFDLFILNDSDSVLSMWLCDYPDQGAPPAEPEGVEAVAVEDLLGDNGGEAAAGLMGDVMTNGLGALSAAAREAVPEFGDLMDLLADDIQLAS